MATVNKDFRIKNGLVTGAGSANELTYPTSDGTSGQVLTTDGAGNLTFSDASASFGASVFHELDMPAAIRETYANWGGVMAISGNYAIVGYDDYDDGANLYSGIAHIYDVRTGLIVHTLDNPNAYNSSAYDRFGFSVAISGNYAVVGALGEDTNSNASGLAYVFDVTTGSYVRELTHPSPSTNDYFGHSVGISGKYVIVGAPNRDDATHADSGKAYIFDITTEDPGPIWTLDNPNGSNARYGDPDSDQFGYKVAISGKYAMVSGEYEDDGASGVNSGKVYIYNVTTGALVHTLSNPNPDGVANFDYFGSSISISGNYAIVGTYGEDESGSSDSGKAYIYNVNTGTLLHTLDNPNAYDTVALDRFGKSVAISGNYAIVGADGEDESGASTSGKAYIFDVTSGSLVATLDNPNANGTAAIDQFGMNVAISGGYAMVHARNESGGGTTESGKLYIYQLSAPDYVPNSFEFSSFTALKNDASPKLSAKLETQNNNIVGSSGTAGNLTIYATDGVFDGTLTLRAGPFSGSGYTGTVNIGGAGTGSDTETVNINGLAWPSSDGSNGQVLTTDGSGNLSFADAAGGGAASLNELSDAYYDSDLNLGIGSASYSFTAGSGLRNIAIGQDAGNTITSGDDNITIGYNAGTSLTTGASSIAIGANALSSAGYIVGATVIGASASGYLPAGSSTAVGYNANRYGYDDTLSIYFGSSAGYGTTSYSGHSYNSHIGTSAGYNIFGGDHNTMLGHLSGYNINNGSNNVFLGSNAGYGTSTDNNTFVGMASGREADGAGNTALGKDAGYYLDGNYNIAIGYQALNNSSITGNYNIGIGYNVDTSATNVSNELTFGAASGQTGQILRMRIPGLGFDTSGATAGQVITADGSGGMSFQDAAGGSETVGQTLMKQALYG